VEFRILGPVEIWADGRRHDLGSPKEACVLAVLLLTPGRPVSADALVDHVWGADPPAKVRGSLWSYIARLRRVLEADARVRVVSRSGLYVLETDPEAVDLHRFRRLRAQARALAESGEIEHAALMLREAEDLWTGEALAGLPGDWARQTRAALEQERLAATMDRIESDLASGRESDLGELSELISRHPFVERIVEHLMVALYRAGRQAEALDAYRQTRLRLRDELGTEPGPALRALHQRILKNDPDLATQPRIWTRRPMCPNNLPRDVPYFTGRAGELSSLAEAVVAGGSSTAPTVIAIDGMAGVGKSALAIHMAHRLAGQFPDGQILLSLHAHDPYEEPIDPVTALDRLLRIVLAASSGRLFAGPGYQPDALEMYATLWRERVANRRLLIVLDDAASGDQVRSLLPGTPGCLVLITSRRRLTGLAGAVSLSLDVMQPPDAAELFGRIVGPERSHNAAAIIDVVRLCGHMPLAIQLAASRLRHRPAWTAADVARLLSRTQNRLREIRGEELEVASSFELSYRYLSPLQQVVFRQVGYYPGPDFSSHAVSAANGLALVETDRILDGLLGYHTLEEPEPGRFRCHDLLREYARELALREETESGRLSTMHRLLDYYLYVAAKADDLLFPYRHRLRVTVDHIPAEMPPIKTRREAQEWMDAERQNMLAAVQYAAVNGSETHCALLPHVMALFLEVGGHWPAAVSAHECALAAWARLGDRRGEARAHVDICLPRLRSGHFDDALHHGQEALTIFRSLGEDSGAADALDRLGLVHWHAARYPSALEHFEESLAIYQAVGDRYGEAEVLGHSGAAYWHVGRYAAAIDAFEHALELYRELGDSLGEGKMLNNIGDVEQRLGDYDDALSHYQQALPIAREVGGRQAEAVLLNNIGNSYRYIGRYDEALVNLRSALGIYRDIGDRRCEADSLNNIGTTFVRMLRYDEALIHHQKALTIARNITEDYLAAHALRSIGDVYQHLDQHTLAFDHYQQALDLSRRIGDPYEEACSLDGIGCAILRAQGIPAARFHWRQALAIFETIGVPEADTVRSRLQPQENVP
jgi:DNA-binding SARP family transcriptional activator/tetratricopeptide (TPR) repeat protein